MADNFPLWLKSTVDKVMADVTASLQDEYPDLKWAEVDDMAETDDVFKKEEPALLWQFGFLSPRPRAPLYDFEFVVGAKTVADAGNYTLLALLSAIRDAFKANTTLVVRDYTLDALDPVSTVDRGYLEIMDNEIEPQKFDKQSGIRYATVTGKAVAYGN